MIDVQDLPMIERLRVVRLREASRLSGLSIETLRLRHRDKIIHLSKRACGMRIQDVLSLSVAK